MSTMQDKSPSMRGSYPSPPLSLNERALPIPSIESVSPVLQSCLKSRMLQPLSSASLDHSRGLGQDTLQPPTETDAVDCSWLLNRCRAEPATKPTKGRVRTLSSRGCSGSSPTGTAGALLRSNNGLEGHDTDILLCRPTTTGLSPISSAKMSPARPPDSASSRLAWS